jgi:hypothetical protein
MFNESKLQSSISSLCGQFCIYFLSCRILNPDLTYADLCNVIFSDTLKKNDEIVSKFYENGDFFE